MHNDSRRADTIAVFVFAVLGHIVVLLVRNNQCHLFVDIIQLFIAVIRPNIRLVDSEIGRRRCAAHKTVSGAIRRCHQKPSEPSFSDFIETIPSIAKVSFFRIASTLPSF